MRKVAEPLGPSRTKTTTANSASTPSRIGSFQLRTATASATLGVSLLAVMLMLQLLHG